MRFAAVACVLVACGTGNGISIDVVPTAGVTHVELFVTEHCSGSCTGPVTPPGFAELPSQLFEVPMESQVWVAELSDGVAGFRLINDSAEPQTIPLLAAVGYNAMNQAIAATVLEDVEIAPGQDDYWHLKLSPAGMVDPQGARAPAGTVRVMQWDTDVATLPSCTVIENGPDRYAIGPEDDNDCDEVPTRPECAPWTYVASTQPGTIATARCAVSAVLAETNRSACLAAGPLCDETNPMADGCERIDEDFCMSQVICGCPGWDLACLGNKLSSFAETYIACVVPLRDSTSVCDMTTTFEPFDLQPYLAGTPHTCDSVRLHELATTIGPFDTKAELPNSTALTVKQFSPSCTVELEWTGSSTSTSIALASLDLSNDKHILLPLLVRFATAADCSAKPMCMLHPAATGYDSALACAAPSVNPGLCDAVSPCMGPMCNGECCNYGEQCVSNECRCGNGGMCPSGEQCGANPIGGGCGGTCCNPTAMPTTCTF